MRLLKPHNWLAALLDPNNRFTVHERFFGEAVRRDGWQCRNRTEPWHLVYLALEGRSTGRDQQNQDISIEAGQVLWLPPNASHDFTWTPTFRYAEVWFQIQSPPHRHSKSPAMLTPIKQPLRLAGAMEIRPLFDRIAEELRIPRPLHNQSLRCLIATLTVALFRLQQTADAPRAGLSPAQREALSRYAQLHIADRVGPSDLARQTGLTLDYFARRFRESYGCSPRNWLAREKMRTASRLLSNSNMRTSQIAHHLGYSDVPQFSRQFKAVTGLSPQQFRSTAIAQNIVEHRTKPTNEVPE